MKRIPLAALLAFGSFVLARADEGAYKSLTGMAQAAATDRGPDVEADTDAVPRNKPAVDELKDSVADVPSPRAPEANAAAEALPAALSAAKTDAAPGAVLVPAAGKPRLWTRLYATLLPSWRRASSRSSFEPALSTGTVRVRMTPLPALMPPPDSEAVSAGERRGMAELMSVSDPASAQ